MSSSSSGRDVLHRLDSLLLQERGDQADGGAKSSRRQNSAGNKPQGILKARGGKGEKKTKNARSIRFPDNEEMHEIIGYGGDAEQFFSEDDDEE